jgi:drug/metabolite transporter (DMT)-like permease
MKYKVWLAFCALGLIWGTSFLWIKIAVSEAGPFTVVGLRILFGLLGLLAVIAVQRPALPRDRRRLLAYVFMGVFNTGLPFLLITWGETSIPSGVAAILDATVPLFTIIIAHFWLHDEKITTSRLGGLLVGFAGIVVLVSGDLRLSSLSANIWGQLAVVGAAISYAMGITFARRHLRNEPPLIQSAAMMLIADSLVWAASFGTGQPFAPPHSALAWFALLWLGLLGTCVAYLLYFFIINEWGPTRASLVTYILPVVGLALGVLFLHEKADWPLLAGSALIVGGIGIVNLRPGQRELAPQAAGAD